MCVSSIKTILRVSKLKYRKRHVIVFVCYSLEMMQNLDFPTDIPSSSESNAIVFLLIYNSISWRILSASQEYIWLRKKLKFCYMSS